MILIIKCLKLSLFIINAVTTNMMLLIVMILDYHNDEEGFRALKKLDSTSTEGTGFLIFRALRIV